MDLVRLAHYPFLQEARQAVRDAGIGVDDVLSSALYEGVRRRAVERVKAAMGAVLPPANVVDDRSALLELLAHPVARMLVVACGERTLLTKYAELEAGQVQQALQKDHASLPEILAALEIPAVEEVTAWRLHVTDYLRLAPSQPDWKLVTKSVARGHVSLATNDLVRLVREALASRIAGELAAESERPFPSDLRKTLGPQLDQLAKPLEEAREAWTQGDFGPVQPQLFPPCIKEIFDGLRRGENAAHHARFAFATFLHTVGWNAEQILDYLSATPNFDREKSRYQIQHVSGEKGVEAYTPPSCATLQTHGVCPLAKRDGLCHKIKHPLSYYRAQLRFAQKDIARAAQLAKTSRGAARNQDAGAVEKPGMAPEANPTQKAPDGMDKRGHP